MDAWEYAEPTEPAATWDRANPHVAATFTPSSRVDYIHVGHVSAVRRVGAEPVDGVWPSDHAGVVAELFRGPIAN